MKIPRIKLVTPVPTDDHPFLPVELTHITVDGEEWGILDYKVGGSVGGFQKVSLTFVADLTIEHPEP